MFVTIGILLFCALFSFATTLGYALFGIGGAVVSFAVMSVALALCMWVDGLRK